MWVTLGPSLFSVGQMWAATAASSTGPKMDKYSVALLEIDFNDSAVGIMAGVLVCS